MMCPLIKDDCCCNMCAMWENDRGQCGIKVLINCASGILYMIDEERKLEEKDKKTDTDVVDTPF